MAAPTSASLSTDDIFWADADRYLIRYAGAGAFTREIIDHAAGSFLFTEDGRYWMPLEYGQTDPILHNSLFYDDKLLLRIRVERIRDEYLQVVAAVESVILRSRSSRSSSPVPASYPKSSTGMP